MITRLIAAIALMFAACGGAKPRPAPRPFPEHEELGARYRTYLALLPELQDADGFVETDRCDSLIFSGLIGAAGARVNIAAAQDPSKPGRWYRRPTSYPECFASGASGSTISRDQLLGLFWFLHARGDKKTAAEMWRYGEARSWVMGDDRTAGLSTVMNPTMLTLLAKLTGGPGVPGYAWASQCAGYTCHLALLQVALAMELEGAVSRRAQELAEYAARRNPANALAAAVVAKLRGDSMSGAARLLLANPAYPAGRLPTDAEVCEEWPMQRDDTALKPCPERARRHSGGDFIFTAWYMLNH